MLLEFYEMPIFCSVCLDKVKQPLRHFELETFQQLTNYNVNQAAEEEASLGRERQRKEGRFHRSAEHVPFGPDPELLVFSAARRRSQWVPHLSATLRIEKYLSYGSYLSVFIPWHTHTHALLSCHSGKINCHHGNNMHWQTHSLPGNEMPHNPLLPGAGV